MHEVILSIYQFLIVLFFVLRWCVHSNFVALLELKLDTQFL